MTSMEQNIREDLFLRLQQKWFVKNANYYQSFNRMFHSWNVPIPFDLRFRLMEQLYWNTRGLTSRVVFHITEKTIYES